jgi:alpha-glucuronidase
MQFERFFPQDGRFADNVIIQPKDGPVDFQIREAPNPLFGRMERTPMVMEVQITQEYTGQSTHVDYLVPRWKNILDFNTQLVNSPVKDHILGLAGVANVGDDVNWTGHDLAQANFYGYGRLAWDPDLSSEQIADEWTQLTFGGNSQVTRTVNWILLRSWPAVERFTSPLGSGLISNSHNHYTPGLLQPVPQSEALDSLQPDRDGVGYERKTFISEYAPPVQKVFAGLAECPDELLLFLHHVPYIHHLKSGKTVIQHIYDSHYDGYWDILRFQNAWASLKGKIDDQTFRRVERKFAQSAYDAGDEKSLSWVRAVVDFFSQKSGIADAYVSQRRSGMDFTGAGNKKRISIALEYRLKNDSVPHMRMAAYGIERAGQVTLSLNGHNIQVPDQIVQPGGGTLTADWELLPQERSFVRNGQNILSIDFAAAEGDPSPAIKILELKLLSTGE